MPTRMWSQEAWASPIGGVLTLVFGLLLMSQGVYEIAVGRLVATYGVSTEGLVVGKQIRERRGRHSGGHRHHPAKQYHLFASDYQVLSFVGGQCRRD